MILFPLTHLIHAHSSSSASTQRS